MKLILALLMMLGLGACASLPSATKPLPETTQTASLKPAVPSISMVAMKHPPPIVSPKMPYTQADVNCMSSVLYHEARGESDKGLEGVGYVVMNRVHSKRFPNTVCGVVHQGIYHHGHIVRYHCAFSWYCDGRPDTIHNLKEYNRCKEIAKLVLIGFAPNPVGKCLYFHAARRHHRDRHRRLYAAEIRIGRQLFYELADRG